MLVLTVKDTHRIAVWHQVGDEQVLLGWLKFHAPSDAHRDHYWTLEHTGDGTTSVYPSDFITKVDCPDGTLRQIECIVSKHSRAQWQAKFAAPTCIRLIREKAVLKHGIQLKSKQGATHARNP